MAGNYPSDSQIAALAGQWAVNPASVYAYCAYNQGALPSNVNMLNGFVSTMQGNASALNVPIQLLYGYLTTYGTVPSHGQIYTWAQQAGYMDSAGNLLYTPAAGQNFIGDIAVTNPTIQPAATPNAQIAPPASSPLPAIDLSSLTSNKLVLGFGALAALYILNPGHWRGR